MSYSFIRWVFYDIAIMAGLEHIPNKPCNLFTAVFECKVPALNRYDSGIRQIFGKGHGTLPDKGGIILSPYRKQPRFIAA